MRNQRQPNDWSCVAMAFSNVLDITLDEFIKVIGHDGSKTNGFSPIEGIFVANKLGFKVEQFASRALTGAGGIVRLPISYVTDELPLNEGVIAGIINNNLHAVAWDGQLCFDSSNGYKYSYSLFSELDIFWKIYKP